MEVNILTKIGRIKTCHHICVLKDGKTFTAEESSDKFSGTWKVEGSDVILEGVDTEKGGDDQGGEDIGVRFDAKNSN